jgi:hypothetical protein
MPALAPYIVEPIWEQFCALLSDGDVDHPLGCHRPRICVRVIFEKLVQILVFGCGLSLSCSLLLLLPLLLGPLRHTPGLDVGGFRHSQRRAQAVG